MLCRSTPSKGYASTQHSCTAAQESSWRERETSWCSWIPGGFSKLRTGHLLVHEDWTQEQLPKDGTHGYSLGVLPSVHPQELEKARPRVADFISCDHPVKSKARKGTHRNSLPCLLTRGQVLPINDCDRFLVGSKQLPEGLFLCYAMHTLFALATTSIKGTRERRR